MISHHHKTIFVHIPKCGGQSIEHMFLEDLGLTWETREPLLLRQNDSPELGPPRLAHLLARDYVRLGHISQEKFDGYFKFAVVRDPYARALSLFNYLSVTTPRSSVLKTIFGARISKALVGQKRLNLDDFFLDWLPDKFSEGDKGTHKSKFFFVRRQVDYLVGPDGATILDQVIRLEDLNDKVDDLRARCGLKSQLGHVNKSKTVAASQDLLPKHLDAIETLYAEDFEVLGYNRRPR